MNRIFLLLLVTLLLSSCNNEERQAKESTKKQDIPQDYEVFPLPPELDEISGIAFIDSTTLIAIQDEEGLFFYYDLSTRKITDTIRFAGAGDYEDVAIAGNTIYAVTSDGILYEIKDFKTSSSIVAQKSQTPFKGKNNVEGLAYDPLEGRLLFAPKDQGLDNDKDKEIYEYDLTTKQLNTSPVYSIRLQQIEDYFKGDAIEESSKKFLKAIGNQNLNEVFRPSAMAVHPESNEIYILSSINNLIAVLTREGVLRRLIELRGNEFSQPEGMGFSSTGQLYVSNEGKGGKANIILLIYEK